MITEVITAIKIQGLTKCFGKKLVLDNVSIDIESGTTCLLLGPNGAGKTTLLRCILGLLRFRGKIIVDGIDVSHSGERARAKIGYLPQQSSYYDNLTVMQHCKLMARLKNVSDLEIEERLRQVGLQNELKTKVKNLSSGMKQRLGLGIALLGDPPVLILDEPTSNIDAEGQIEFKTLLSKLEQQGKTFLISTHTSGLDEYSDQIVVLNHGRVVAKGTASEMIQKIGGHDTVTLKVDDNQTELLMNIANGFGTTVRYKDGWSIVPMKQPDKIKFIEKLVASGINIKDIIIQPLTVEEEYMKIIDTGE